MVRWLEEEAKNNAVGAATQAAPPGYFNVAASPPMMAVPHGAAARCSRINPMASKPAAYMVRTMAASGLAMAE